MWKYWCKAIGTKAYDDDRKADTVAIYLFGYYFECHSKSRLGINWILVKNLLTFD
jgi:hypothetical protein